MSITTIYHNLHFHTVNRAITSTKVDYQPVFICPNCKTKDVLPVMSTVNFQEDKTFDSNERHTFILPCCGAEVELFVAIHKAPVEDGDLCLEGVYEFTVYVDLGLIHIRNLKV